MKLSVLFDIKNLKPKPLLGLFSDSEIWDSPFSLFANSAYCVQAPSGKGKSTFAHILYGLRSDYEGQVLYKGQDIKTITAPDWAEIRQSTLSIIFQNLRLFPDLSAMANIEIKNKLTGHKSKEEILGMAKQLGVDHLLEKPCGQLSYGQQQRIAIIRALCQPFELIILDEPFSHLDPENISKAGALIEEECKKQGSGLILVTLDQSYGLTFDFNRRL